MSSYHQVDNLEEALSLLAKPNHQFLVFAGGTDLMVQQKEAIKNASRPILSLSQIKELKDIQWHQDFISIGAAVTIQKLADDECLKKSFPCLAQGAISLGSWQVRNLATLGGNICNASPSADLGPPLLVYDTQVVLKSITGERTINLSDFLLGPGQKDLAENELLICFKIPRPAENSISLYLKHSPRRAMEIALVGVACLLTFDGLKIKTARLSLGAVAITALRLQAAEEYLAGKMLTAEVIENVAKMAQAEAKPISDIRSSAEYRLDMVGVYVKKALNLAQQRFNDRG